jgi:hypothetical protein
MKAFVAALAVVLASPAAVAADADAPAQKKERKICKRDPNSGSRMEKKICRTAAQWKRAQQNGGDVSVPANGGGSQRSN